MGSMPIRSNVTCVFRPKLWPEGMQDCVFGFSDKSEKEASITLHDEWPAAAAVENVWEGNKTINTSLLFVWCDTIYTHLA